MAATRRPKASIWPFWLAICPGFGYFSRQFTHAGWNRLAAVRTGILPVKVLNLSFPAWRR